MTVLNAPAYTYRAKGRYWYFRHNGLQTRISAEPGTPEFDERYQELLRLSWSANDVAKVQPRRIVEAAWNVYFLGWLHGPIKIGIALDPITRLYQAQTYVPYKLELWATCEGGFYRCNACLTDFTVRTGTIFERSKIPLHKWIYAMYLLVTSRKGISSLQLAKQIGVTQKSAWFMLQRLREACGNDPHELAGIVECDETYVGGREANRHASPMRS
jgi:hypothetical protein